MSRERCYPIDKLGAKREKASLRGFGVFTFKFSTEALLDKFDLPLLSELDDTQRPGFDFWLRNEDLVGLTCLDVGWDEEGGLVDGRGKVLTSAEVDDIKTAFSDATTWGTLGKVRRKILHALEQMLGTFADYRYEYLFQTDEGSVFASGVATGIISIEAEPDTTTIIAQDDIIHIINHNIAGVGMFCVTDDFEGEDPYQFAKTRFGWLSRHWGIHGGSPPEVDMDNVEEFNEIYFRRQLKSMRGLKLIPKSRKARKSPKA